jgi:hypothetical protein
MTRYSVECWNCTEGYIEGDCTCGDDTCCCLDPDPPECSECHGTGRLIVTQLPDDPDRAANAVALED